MKQINRFYRTSNLYNYGVFIAFSSLILILVGKFVIQEPGLAECPEQIYTLNGKNAKYNDNAEVSTFLRSIRSNNGYLCLGTSESSFLEGENYYGLLNDDKKLSGTKISYLAGAGRTCGIHIPIFLQHKEFVDSLNVIYFINPVYWRNDLAEVNMEYWNRYSNYSTCTNVALTDMERSRYYGPVQEYLSNLNIFQKATMSLEYHLRDSKRGFSENLTFRNNPKNWLNEFTKVPKASGEIIRRASENQFDSKEIDTIWNISYSFENKHWFQPINESNTYRFEELQSFINLCSDLNINVTFILGPYNERFITQYSPESLNGYSQISDRIRELLIQSKCDFIDATDLSNTPGAFIDHQHHSRYGAYLIYKKIKSYLLEKTCP